MPLNIDYDLKRFQDKIRARQKQGLDKYFSRDTMIVPQPNGRTIKIPIDRLDLPRFIYGDNNGEGVGQGEGDIGDIINPGNNQTQGRGSGTDHGDGAGVHDFSEFSLEEAADILGEHLELPNLLEKYGGNVGVTSERRYKNIQPIGPKSLRHPRRTFRRALQRSIGSGMYNPDDPQIILRREDERFKAPQIEIKPATKAAVIWLLDYSGSMGQVINFCQHVGWWGDAWIRKHYQEVRNRYIQYDSFAKEVSPSEFFSVEAGGGTSMSAGLTLAKKVIQTDYPESEYNVYVVHF